MVIAVNINTSRENLHSWVYFICLCLLVASIPTSRFMVSVSQILLFINWLAEGKFKYKLKAFITNKPALAFVMIYGIHIIGLLWTQDINYAVFHDLRHKLPTLLLTLILVTTPLPEIKKSRTILFIFVATVLSVTFISLYIYLFKGLVHYRDLLPFTSHLYFSMMLIISAFLLPWLIKQVSAKKSWYVLALSLSAWMIVFLFMTRSLSGIASLAGVILFMIIWIILYHKSTYLRVIVLVTFIASIAGTSFYLHHIYSMATHKAEYDLSQLDTHTKHGNPYYHNLNDMLRENGHLVYIYIADGELEKAWNERSEIEYYSKGRTGQEVRYTLYRYMASKGYKKDKEHLKMISDEEITAIENGITNHLFLKWPGISVRIYETISGIIIYNESNNPMWSTLTQRLDLWKASVEAIKKNPIIGWGTGDIFIAMKYGLEKTESPLRYYRQHGDSEITIMKPHNQYLLFLITLGVLGLILFIYFYTYTVVKTKGYKLLPFNIFVVAYAVNMLANNPIDAQIGQTMFVFFTVFFCFIYPKSDLKF